MMMGKKPGNYEIIRLFIERFGRPEWLNKENDSIKWYWYGPPPCSIDWRKVYASNHYESKYRADMVAHLADVNIPHVIGEIVSQYWF